MDGAPEDPTPSRDARPHLWPATVVLVGPTAVGKSALALTLARRLGAAIVTADSRQVYRYMDIGTAKPSRSEQAQAPHYLIDLVEPNDTYTAQRFRAEGTRVLRRLAAEGRPAIVAGGTGFYLRALLDGEIWPQVPPNPELRASLGLEAAELGAEALHRRLNAIDSASAARIHPRNLPRLIRALEIVAVTGGPVPPVTREEPVPALWLGLHRDRDDLRVIADRRVEAQVQHGLLAETETLLAMGYDPALPALQGFGYRQMIDHLQGRLSLPEAVQAYQNATRGFIRRQLTWFRADPRIRWFEAGPAAEREAMWLIGPWLEGREPG